MLFGSRHRLACIFLGMKVGNVRREIRTLAAKVTGIDEERVLDAERRVAAGIGFCLATPAVEAALAGVLLVVRRVCNAAHATEADKKVAQIVETQLPMLQRLMLLTDVLLLHSLQMAAVGGVLWLLAIGAESNEEATAEATQSTRQKLLLFLEESGVPIDDSEAAAVAHLFWAHVETDADALKAIDAKLKTLQAAYKPQ